MKAILFCCAMTMLCVKSKAQTFKDFGVPTTEDLKLSSCSFDPDADAILLVKEAVADYNDNHNLITEYHIRLKILKDKGISYADVSIPYITDGDFEFIDEIVAMAINVDSDGNVQRQLIEKKLIFKQRVNENYGVVRFSFPSVKAGSILEYRYRSTMKNYNGLRQWDFQEDLPVATSKYKVSILPGYEFSYVVHKSDMMKLDVKNDGQSGKVEFVMNNIPALTAEPYMDARRDYLQRVTFQLSGYGGSGFNKQRYMTSWNEVIKEMMSDKNFGMQLNKNLHDTDEFIKLVKLNPSPEIRMRLVHEYVRSHMSWDGSNSKWSIDGVKEAWNKKSGTSGDINLILVNLLESAGLEVYPMLVAERYFGKVNPDIAFIDQFNKVMAAVLIDNKKYYLDASDRFTPAHIIPSGILNTSAFIVNRKAGGIQTITDESHSFRESISVSLNIGKDGRLTGKTNIISADYAKVERLEEYKFNSENYLDKYFKRSLNNIEITDFEMDNEQKDSLGLNQHFSFSAPMNGSGEYTFIGINLFTGYIHNPFLSSSRFSHINFGYKKNITAKVVMDIPDGYIIDGIPKSLKLTNADRTIIFTREILKDEKSNKLVSRINIDCKSSYFPVERYGEIREFYKKMFDLLNEQIVLKKN